MRGTVAAFFGVLALACTIHTSHAQSTAFTYQGALSDGTGPANGLFDMTFGLFTTDTEGTAVSTITKTSIFVTNGLFNTTLNFGAWVFDGTDNWLEIEVSPTGSLQPPVILSPRQPLNAAPYAIHARMAMDVVNPMFLGTTTDAPLEFYVNNQRGLRLEPTGFSGRSTVNIIGGYVGNRVEEGVSAATISGGGNYEGFLSGPHYAGAYGSTIGGGDANWIGKGGLLAVIGGGVGNRNNGRVGVISGGGGNTIETNALFATISGGGGNTIGTNGQFATIGGGEGNIADGPYSFAAGRRARVLHEGSFVWADSITTIVDESLNIISFASTSTNEFAVRATGGVRFVTGIDTNGTPTAGVQVPAGGTGWSVISDRNMKENFEPVDGKEVLKQVAAMPIQRWNMKTQDPSIRHIGPMAQDFHAAFGLGESDRRINTVDADGVALAAIQGLNQKLEEKDREMEELKSIVAELKAMVMKLSLDK